MNKKKSHIHCDVCDIDIRKSDWDNHLDSDELGKNS